MLLEVRVQGYLCAPYKQIQQFGVRHYAQSYILLKFRSQQQQPWSLNAHSL